MSGRDAAVERWPAIPYAEWQSTCGALHLYVQIVGKYRLARSPWVNHSWHATFYVTPRGLTTSLVPDVTGGIEVSLDFVDHVVRGACHSGRVLSFPLQPMTVAAFHRQFVDMITELGGTGTFNGVPNELPDATPFAEDTAPRPYAADAVARFHQALVSVNRVFQEFRTGFCGKVSPVHLFWGSFDLAVTRFSGRPAPTHPGGIPNLPDDVTREAYSHEVSSAGFWPGGGPVDDAAFYAYAYPQPEGFPAAAVQPEAATYNQDFGEFVLPYDAVRTSADPQATLLAFLESTYEAAASLANWDRSQEYPRGAIGSPPPISTPDI
jgi:hypothetical protein